jgi:peptidoglycan/LPS O-acetylase OafA/YrhL
MVAFILGISLAELYHSHFYLKIRNCRGSLPLSITILMAVWLYSTLHGEYSQTPLTLPFIASAVVLAIMINKRVIQVFENKGSLFLGHISFALYLTHLLVICSVISSIYLCLNKAGLDAQTILLLTTLIMLPICLIVAWAFLPIEKIAIFLSTRFANAILNRG